MKCPKCKAFNLASATECETCGVIFAHAKRGEERPAGPATCSWVDHGKTCVCRGILSTGTRGEGPWYCREHWRRANGIEPAGRGNYPVTPVSSPGTGRWSGWWEKWKDDPKRRELPRPL